MCVYLFIPSLLPIPALALSLLGTQALSASASPRGASPGGVSGERGGWMWRNAGVSHDVGVFLNGTERTIGPYQCNIYDMCGCMCECVCLEIECMRVLICVSHVSNSE